MDIGAVCHFCCLWLTIAFPMPAVSSLLTLSWTGRPSVVRYVFIGLNVGLKWWEEKGLLSQLMKPNWEDVNITAAIGLMAHGCSVVLNGVVKMFPSSSTYLWVTFSWRSLTIGFGLVLLLCLTGGVHTIACLPKASYTLPLTTRIISSIHPCRHALKILNEFAGTFGVVFQDLDDGNITWLGNWCADFQIIRNIYMLFIAIGELYLPIALCST